MANGSPLSTSLHPLTQAPEPLSSSLEIALHALLTDVSSREARERASQGLHSEVWWPLMTSDCLALSGASFGGMVASNDL